MAGGIDSLLAWVRKSRWLGRHRTVRGFLRSAFRCLLRAGTLNRGVGKEIGSSGRYRLDYAFALSRYETWGTRHNGAFSIALDACKNYRVVFDVGAHIGLYSLPMSRAVGPSGLVVAFEPATQNRHYLKRHIRYNRFRNIRVVPCLVGDVEHPAVRFYESDAPDGMGGLIRYKRPENYHESVAPEVTLDRFCRREALIPGLIKIDVEGSEMKVLTGSRELLVRHKPMIILSVHPRHLDLMGSSASELFTFASSLGYRFLNAAGEEMQELRLDEYVLRPRD